MLGAGAFGKVFLTTNKHDSNIKVAIKVLNKDRLRENLSNIMDEIQTLHTLDHPNIVKYYETYEDVKYIYLVMELCEGGELSIKMIKQTMEANADYEQEVAKYLKTLVLALEHCHS